ncbi:Sensor histidine kinase CitA [Vibrio alginolyticus]|uniref:histidine kinase n=2 Tax=Vibrio harveyi group TaxID=717610 RepID=A0A1W6T8D6_VIBAL|nr:sensor histidine kinase [Vibrio alginolyticus]ARO97239.1 Sensor histidine kinase CitA [Vibrio alginolyticus]ARP01966.1 Sensor histidine kinase CitA [Vibrio alginolyticus]ARP06999.1 Sensor histidine kinase CitA [Vibrio alginolyticus]ARP12085.1 Sensor histidine kinase CitA [Vibrio alginolyticus]ARP17138.1 Sensor histidine kinase CitA [Vibrio alginolyticus]
MPDRTFHDYLCRNLSFRQRVWALLFVVVSFQLLLIGGYFHHILSDTLNHQVSARAVIQAREIASDPQLIEAVSLRDTARVQKQIKRLQGISDANFIVVGDSKGIRLAHPDIKKVGYPMQGGDNIRALQQGLHYYSIREGSLGFAIRGKSSIISSTGEIIGVVSVGYLLDTVSNLLLLYSTPFFFALLIILVCSSLGAWFFSRHIKSQMYGMEPEEIALSLRVQNSVFEAVYEGIIAVDKQGRILSANQRGLKILGIARNLSHLQGRMVNEYVTPADFFLGAKMAEDAEESQRQHQVITCNGETLVATRVKIWEDNQHSGWVISFRPRNDLSTLTSQLNQVQQQTDNLRVLSHEYANKLSTVSGLIQIGAYEEALNAIRQETETHQKLIDFISLTFNSKVIAGLLLGKYSRAKELGLALHFDPYCHLSATPTKLTDDELAAIIGNLLDNAYEATLKKPDSNKCISILISDANETELVIEVADNGTGIPDEIAESLFDKGITSKSQPGHGIGLYLVHQLVNNAGGAILVDDAEPTGTIFSLFIPNESLKDGNL